MGMPLFLRIGFSLRRFWLNRKERIEHKERFLFYAIYAFSAVNGSSRLFGCGGAALSQYSFVSSFLATIFGPCSRVGAKRQRGLTHGHAFAPAQARLHLRLARPLARCGLRPRCVRSRLSGDCPPDSGPRACSRDEGDECSLDHRASKLAAYEVGSKVAFVGRWSSLSRVLPRLAFSHVSWSSLSRVLRHLAFFPRRARLTATSRS